MCRISLFGTLVLQGRGTHSEELATRESGMGVISQIDGCVFHVSFFVKKKEGTAGGSFDSRRFSAPA